MIATLEEQIEKLKQKNKLILVEGYKDKKALEKLGLIKIKTLARKPIYKVAEEVAEITKDVVLLMDLDKEGKKLFGKLNTALQRLGVRVDKRFRQYLFRYTQLRQIEGIASYIENE